jgi:hypothetical protein
MIVEIDTFQTAGHRHWRQAFFVSPHLPWRVVEYEVPWYVSVAHGPPRVQSPSRKTIRLCLPFRRRQVLLRDLVRSSTVGGVGKTVVCREEDYENQTQAVALKGMCLGQPLTVEAA